MRASGVDIGTRSVRSKCALATLPKKSLELLLWALITVSLVALYGLLVHYISNGLYRFLEERQRLDTKEPIPLEYIVGFVATTIGLLVIFAMLTRTNRWLMEIFERQYPSVAVAVRNVGNRTKMFVRWIQLTFLILFFLTTAVLAISGR
jgi:hypothetical protein